MVVTFLALVCTSHTPPTTFVVALVTFTQVTGHALNSLRNTSGSKSRTTSDDTSSTFQKAGFVPYRASTSFPALATDIAELCATATAVDDVSNGAVEWTQM